MAIGLIGQKLGMTRVFTELGESVPVTVIEVLSHRVVQVKTVATDGYEAIQVTTGSKKSSRISRPVSQHYAKSKQDAGRGLWEFRVEDSTSHTVGEEFGVGVFEAGQAVDVQGTTIGKGYAGAVKRHHFSTQDATHGNSLSHRAPGSIGQNQTPGRVFKGKRMSGHLGNCTRTIQNLRVQRVDAERSLLLVRGAVPGSKGRDVVIRPSVKTRNKGEK